jgi:hypothetical protein
MWPASFLGHLLEETDIKVELVRENFNEKVFPVMAWAAGMELESIKERMGMGIKAKLRRGEAWDMHRRYGYALDEDNHLVIDAERGPWVTQMFDWAASGVSQHEIVRRLQRHAAPLPDRSVGLSADKWGYSTVQLILKSPEYWQGFQKAEWDGETFTVDLPPLTDEATYRKAQEWASKNNARPKGEVLTNFLLRGKVYCPCGYSWSVRTMRYWYRNGVRHERANLHGRYRCPLKSSERHPNCPGSISKTKLEAYVLGWAYALLEQPELLKQALHDTLSQFAADREQAEQDLARLDNALHENQNNRDWTISQAYNGYISEDDMQRRLRGLAAEERELKRARDEALLTLAGQQQIEEQFEGLKPYAALFPDAEVREQDEEGLSFGLTNQEVVDKLVEKVTVYADREPVIDFKVFVHQSDITDIFTGRGTVPK